MNLTAEFVEKIRSLGPADLDLLRRCADAPPDVSIQAFDLFTGLWWPLRQRSPRVPARGPSWLVAKLFPWNPRPGGTGTLGAALVRLAPRGPEDRIRERARFGRLLSASGHALEVQLRHGLRRLNRAQVPVDWAQLLEDLTQWNQYPKSPQLKWARDWLGARKGDGHAH